MNTTIAIKNENIVIPTKTFFTLFDVFTLNPSGKQITLRFKVSKKIEKKEIIELGYIPMPVGRPRKAFTCHRITKELLQAATNEGIVLKEGVTA